MTTGIVIPDGIEPIVLARSWIFDGTYLRSPQQTHHIWYPSKPFEATCMAQRSGWWPERGGRMTLAQAIAASNGQEPPSIELPPGYGYTWATRPTHEGCPNENCACGVYGTTDEEKIIGTFGQTSGWTDHPPSTYSYSFSARSMNEGVIVGALVSLWGKIIPGETGARAQYAYPAKLLVPASLADNAALLAYGVPIEASPAPTALAEPVTLPPWHTQTSFWTTTRILHAAIGANLGACAVSVSRAAGLW